MTLRARITLFVAVAVALAVAAVAGAAYVSTADELRNEVDGFLLERAALIERGGLPVPPLEGGEGRPRRGGFRTDAPFVGADALVQIIRTDGSLMVAFDDDVILPIEEADRAIASGARPAQFREVRTDDDHYRLLTIPIRQGGAVQIARDLSENDAILTGLGLRLLGIGGIGVVLAALAGWFVASRSLVPVAGLTAAAEHVAATQELQTPIEVDRDDEIGRLATSFNTMLEALDTSRRQQRRLVTDASHELRTPLTALRTNIEVLARSGDMDAEDRKALLADVTFELEELSLLVAEMVELATDARVSEEPLRDVSLDERVGRVVERARRRTGRTIDLATEPVVVEGRPAMLERATSNLIDNAHKWSPPDALIEVSVAGGRVSVRDHGPGIDEADRPHVFDRFFRATTARSLPGSGLGLSIVKQIVDAHGGTVFAEAAGGSGGAVVGFSIPEQAAEGADGA